MLFRKLFYYLGYLFSLNLGITVLKVIILGSKSTVYGRKLAPTVPSCVFSDHKTDDLPPQMTISVPLSPFKCTSSHFRPSKSNTSHSKTNTFCNVKPDVSKGEAKFHNDVGFATVQGQFNFNTSKELKIYIRQTNICLTDENLRLFQSHLLTLETPITTAADDIHKYFFIVFQRK